MSSDGLPIKWGDAQQYHAEPHDQSDTDEDGGTYGVEPRVHLLTMTERPLQAIAAMAFMYEGRVVRHLDEVTAEEAEAKWADVLATHLDTPLEAVELHFVIEGIDRAMTHQLVRQRVGAAFAQESLRFAVVGDLLDSTTLPPSLAGTMPHSEWVGSAHWVGADKETEKRQRWRQAWDTALHEIDAAYTLLVQSGMPAEEARGLLPHCTATRVHYHTNLRALSKTAGDRLCTQAQFAWRRVVAQMIDAIRGYGISGPEHDMWVRPDRWQYETIADSKLFRPVCFQLGRCPMNASFDRVCSIRERVDDLAAHGVSSEHWDKHTTLPDGEGELDIEPINPAEWLANPGAARV